MRKVILVLITAAIILANYGNVRAAAPFDDFSGNFIDETKWKWSTAWNLALEGVTQVTEGKLVSKVRGNTTSTNSWVFNQLRLIDPNTVNSIQADVALIEGSYSGNIFNVGPQIEGFFYQEAGGAVHAMMNVAKSDQGYSIFYGVNSSAGFEAENPFTVAISANTEYTLKIDYDGNQTFTFSVDDGQTIETRTVNATPIRTGPSQRELKALTTGVWSDSNSTDPGFGYVSASFDNVYINGNPYDDFSNPPLAADKWLDEEIVREIRNNQLHMYVQNKGETRITSDLFIAEDYATDYFQADATITSDTVMSGTPGSTFGEARVYGTFHNYKYDGTGYDNYDGEVYAVTRIRRHADGSMKALASIWTCDDADCNAITDLLLPQEFSCPVALDTPVTLKVKKVDNSSIMMGCNNEWITYTFTTPVYDSYKKERQLRTRLYSTGGESGYLYTTFDNVYIAENFPWATFLPSIMNKKE